jgi:hypothetical protein
MRMVIWAAGMALLSGCSMSSDAKLAQEAVPRFHQMLDAGQFDAIYDESGDQFKRVTTRKDFDDLLQAVHRKLGNTKSSSGRGWRVNYNTSGKFATLSYGTVYDEGEATEQFVYQLQGEKAVLVGYYVNSNTLILK